MPKKPTGRLVPHLAPNLATESKDLCDECEVADAVVTGDHAGLDVTLLELTGCHIEGARFTGAIFGKSRFTDCVVADTDLSGVLFEECRFERVEFRACRLSGLQAAGSRFDDVGFIGCKLDGGNFRMTTWKRAEFQDCELADGDFYGATLPGSIFQGCDLTGLLLSEADLAGSRLQRSTLERMRGADQLRDVVIGSEQIIPVALSVFAALGITVDDEPA